MEAIMAKTERALIVGAGAGLSASLARRLRHDGVEVALAARNLEKLGGLVRETGARAYRCDASRREDVAALFGALDQEMGALDLVIYNPSQRVRGPLIELDPVEVERTLMVTAYGGFLVGQATAKRMLKQGHGSILFTGASASVKGYAQSAPFAMGKFALRGLAQSMARELAPKNIHVAHFVIDGSIGKDPEGESRLDPDAIADTYLHVHRQPRSAWTWEVELRPWVERF
jgi:NAD(P)-dependent dehydrogenase (short-subunit alcohol dehydrogenase family)